MFHEATKSLIKQMGPEEDFIPVRCPADHKHFRVLYLVQRNSKTPWWRKNHYYKTDYKLSDVLLPGQHTAKLDICDSDTFTIMDHVDGKLEGDVGVATDLGTLKLTSSASTSHARTVKVKKRHVSSQVLDSLDGSR
uniref:Uncharacterized protein n=1 Tax=Sphaerodactylus townsendi TaxID=933632 RepID=A0ACB8EUU4_9SAUR